ncbi:hypothetical protein [Fibrobacter sp. UWS1]|nr:hypothetical protein [Fibrobacter sp. UWS1]
MAKGRKLSPYKLIFQDKIRREGALYLDRETLLMYILKKSKLNVTTMNIH